MSTTLHTHVLNQMRVDLPIGDYQVVFQTTYTGVQQGVHVALDNIEDTPGRCQDVCK